MKENRWKHSIEELQEFAKYLNDGHSLTETATHFGVNYGTLKNALTRAGLRERSRSVSVSTSKDTALNSSYFENIDTHQKAYILGFLFADGYISKKVDKLNTLGIALQLQDQYIVEEIKKELNSNRKINIYKNSAKLQITNDKIVADLVNLGICEDKSHQDLKLPDIPAEFMNSFILGYFDGDGCATLKSDGYLTVSICCFSHSFLEEMQQFLKSNGIESRVKKERTNLSVLYISKNEGRVKFYDFIYKDCPVFLKRKHDKIHDNIVRA
jgi:hypothetical protein